MRVSPIILVALLLFGAANNAAAEEVWQPLFNGRDLSGWVNVNTAPETWCVQDGIIICSGSPRGFLRTDQVYENYVLELEWRHVTQGGNAGVMVHADPLPQVGAPYPESVEVQVMDGDGGSMFGIRGCTIVPLTNPVVRGARPRARPEQFRTRPAGEWNHYRLTSRSGNLELAVNGQVVTRAEKATQVKGHLCLESEKAEVHFRGIRIRELPSSDPAQNQVADTSEGFASLFDGLTFRGWNANEATANRWQTDDGLIRLRHDQPSRVRGQDDNLWTTGNYEDFDLIADWRLTERPVPMPLNAFTEDGLIRRDDTGKPVTHEVLHAGDSGIILRGDGKAQVNIWSQPMGSGDINPYHKDAKLPPSIRRACLPAQKADFPAGEWNRFEITMRGQHVSVTLNGVRVIDRAYLPAVAKAGPIGLQNHGDGIEFRNLFIRRHPSSQSKAAAPAQD